MASEKAPGKQKDVGPAAVPAQGAARFWGGPRSIGSLLPAVTRPAFRSRSASAAQLMADWPAIVGPALARASAPRQLSRTTLTLACSGPIALELQHLAGELAARINGHYGRTVVEQFRFIQASAPSAAGPLAPPPAPAPPVAVPGLPAGALRDALASLGGAVAQAAAAPPQRPRASKRPARDA